MTEKSKKFSRDSFHSLTPIVHDWVKALLPQYEFISELMTKYGSPLNIHSALPFQENIETLKSAIKGFGLDHQIFYARKANKCLEFVHKAYEQACGIDTASWQELKDGLDMGIPGSKLVLTAAIKTRLLLQLAIENGVLVVLDNWDEIELVQDVAKSLGKKAKVSFRLGNFSFQNGLLASRFGFSSVEVNKIIPNLTSNGKYPTLQFEGLHFHLNGYSIPHRILALKESIRLADEFANQGMPTKFIDMGGGILVNYLESEIEWVNFHKALRQAVLGQASPITYKNDALGMVLIEGKLYGAPKVYPYFNKNPKDIFLREVLEADFDGILKINGALKKRNIEIRIEPGRSLLDQAGITVARIIFRKHKNDDILVGLEMNRTQMSSSSADFLLDPFYISRSSSLSEDEPVEGFLVGAYCLEQELILKRKVKFSKYPQIGDIMVFVNTAGYMMHFYESQAHLFDLAKNIFLGPDGSVVKDKY
ncbi:MAG: Y4yA family PLP-dependent enzyme [Cyclobacteriaceae bacterium]